MSNVEIAGRGARAARGTRLVGLVASMCLLMSGAGLAKLETWRQEGISAFAKHHRERVVISDKGRVSLGRALVAIGVLKADRVWDLARDRDGAVYAATGDSGKVFRRAKGDVGGWSLVLDATDTQALSLATTPDGKVFVGTGPSGQVIEVSDTSHGASRPDPKVQYIWDLASDPAGNLYAATGPAGQLWKRSPEGKWTLVYDSKASHLLCVAIAPDGSVYTGSDGEGLIYRVGRDGKVSVAYDAPQAEVRSILVAPDGSVYAGTAAESGGAGRPAGLFALDDAPTWSDRVIRRTVAAPGATRPGSARIRLTQAPPSRPLPAPTRPPQGGSAAPRPVTAGDNAVYRIEPDGVVREVFRAKALIFALAWAKDRLLVGTGPDGQLYEVRDRGAESTPIAKLDTGQVLSLLAEPGGDVLVGTGDPGAVVTLSGSHVAEGELVSDVFDAKLISRFGALRWKAETPAMTSIAIQVRSGNVGEPDETWSSWSAAQLSGSEARAEAPTGRFLQYRVKLRTKDPALTPELSSVAISYRSANLPPEFSKLDVPDVSAADGAARQVRLNLRWEVSDPNEDEMSYVVQARKDGWPAWITLTDVPITDKNYAWDTTAFPSGQYRVRVVASDRPSNMPEEALGRDRESPSFSVDHDSPRITAQARQRGALVTLDDAMTRLVKAEYALDGGPWTPVFPDDGLFDTLHERVTISLPDLKSGAHLLMVRSTDAAGNVGAGDVILEGGP